MLVPKYWYGVSIFVKRGGACRSLHVHIQGIHVSLVAQVGQQLINQLSIVSKHGQSGTVGLIWRYYSWQL
jgi:hypothetical protein